jgi:hypothetical protein
MESFEIIEKIVGHIAWPLVAILALHHFSDEFRSFIRRIQNAKFKNVELDLEKEIQDIKSDAVDAGITIAYDISTFPRDSIESIETAPEWAFIKSWQEIENTLQSYYNGISGLKTNRANIKTILNYLEDHNIIDVHMKMIIEKLRATRNLIVHNPDPSITRGEALEWLGIAKSVKDRLDQKLRS